MNELIMGLLPDVVASNLGTVTSVVTLLFGSYVGKVKRAQKKFNHMITELQETQAMVQEALKPDEKGATVIDEQEAKDIARELQEDVLAIHDFGTEISNMLPKGARKFIPFAK